MVVEARGERRQRQLARDDAEDAAGDARLGGHADVVHPVAGGIVHARRRHHRQDPLHGLLAEHPLAGHGMDAAGGQRRADGRQVADVERDGALPAVAVEDLQRVAGDGLGRPQQVGDRAVAEAGVALALPDVLVGAELPAGQLRQPLEDEVVGAAADVLLQQAVDGQRAGVDHRVDRPAPLIQGNLVEGVAGGLDADALEDLLQAELLDGQAVNQWLRHRLDGELVVDVAECVEVAFGAHDGGGPQVGVDVGQRRNVRGILPVRDLAAVLGEGVERFPERGSDVNVVHSVHFTDVVTVSRTWVRGARCGGGRSWR